MRKRISDIAEMDWQSPCDTKDGQMQHDDQ